MSDEELDEFLCVARTFSDEHYINSIVEELRRLTHELAAANARIAELEAKSPARQKMVWLIERGQIENQQPTLWWIEENQRYSGGKWTELAYKATKYPSKHHASTAITQADLHFAHPSEHIFLDAVQRSAEEAVNENPVPQQAEHRQTEGPKGDTVGNPAVGAGLPDFYCETPDSGEPPCAGLVALRARIAGLEEENERFREVTRWELARSRNEAEGMLQQLALIYSFMLPEGVQLPDGRVFEFNNPEIEREMLRSLCEAIRSIEL